jgi:misacylated tRNA(Ala) deacylase
MFLPVAANVGLRLSITVIAPLAFAFRPAGPLFVRRRHLSICKMVAASPSGVFSSAKDARAFVAESVLATGDIIKCGELACQINSFQTTLDGTKPLAYAIYEETASKTKKGGKSNKKKGGTGEDDGTAGVAGPRLVLALSNSILYPEGGGQPYDTGNIIIKRPSSSDAIELSVTEVSGMNQVCLITCPLPADEQERIVEALQSHGTVIDQHLDWDRRFDLMTQHSAQHLISAVALSEPFGYNTHSFSLSTKSDISYVDLLVQTDIDTDVHRENVQKIEEIVNSNIRLNLPMTPRYLDEEDLKKAKESGEVRSRLLPEGVTGKIRLVEIGDGINMVDQNTCGGTHVSSLAQLQMVKFFRLDRQKSNVLRVYFAAGKRLMNIMNAAYKREDDLTNIFSCMEPEIVGRVESMVEDRREKEREIQKLNEKLCSFQAKEIIEELNANGGVAAVDVGGSDMQFKTILTNAVLEARGSDGMLLLVVGGSESGEEGSFLLVGDDTLVGEIGKDVAAALKGRGGGRGGKFQGKGSNIRKGLEEARNLMLQIKA